VRIRKRCRKFTGASMAPSPTPHFGLSQRTRLSAMQAAAERVAPLPCIPPGLLVDFAQQALQMTHATGAAVALEHRGELIWRAAVGAAAPEVGSAINTESGLTGVCVYSGTTQLCSNTELDSRVDAEACRQLGVRAIIVVPLFRKDRLFGLLEVFARRPYAFGKRDLQALHELAERISEKLQIGLESQKAAVRSGRKELWATEQTGQPRFSRFQRVALFAVAIVACAVASFNWGWRQIDPVNNPGRARVTTISTVAIVPPRIPLSPMFRGVLIHRVDPAYPAEALRQRLEGSVVVEARIGRDGSVDDARAIRGEDVLAQAAVEAVRRWRFTPYTIKGKPIEVLMRITLEFSLPT
jgi:TonB family protein